MNESGLLVGQGFEFGCLRALERRDATGMLEWMHDPDVAGVFQNDFSDMTLGDAEAFIDSCAEPGASLHFAVSGAGGEYMGTVSLKGVDTRNRSAEYAISMRSAAHGTGLSMSATVDVLRYAFGVLGLHRVYLCVRSDNARARRFYEKAGFRHEGTSVDALFIDEAYRDLEWYAVLEGDELGQDA